MQQPAGIFQAGHGGNVLIQVGQDGPAPSVHNCYDAGDGFKHLQAHVAPTAYASQQDGDAPKCHPRTRTAILKAVMDWVLVATTGLQWILWINGAAGAGKSAIARSVVDLCLEHQIIIVRFFFFRTDSKRNTIKPVVATFAYQLIQSIPALDSIITPKIRSNPLIFQESLDTQFKVLIFEPLRQLHKESPIEKVIVFLVDGVDECSGDENQANVIHTIAEFVTEKAVPLIVIFSSRTEVQLQMAFNSPRINSILRRLPLDTDYRATEDIRVLLDDSFAKIKATHPAKSSIVPEWPAPSLVQEIVDKSSNQFIYASVVIKFISSPRLHPVRQLEIVHGLRPAGALTPFAQLDALYRYIFSQVHDITRVTEVLVVAILSDHPFNLFVYEMLGIEEYDLKVALADLTSVVANDCGRIIFLHASLVDFLLDQSRAQQYYIDTGLWGEQLAVTILSKRINVLSLLCTYLSQARCTPQLRVALHTFHPSDYAGWGTQYYLLCVNAVHKMDFGDGGELYRHQLDLVVRYIDQEYPQDIHCLGEFHDITGILDKIAGEKAEKASARKTQLPVEEETPVPLGMVNSPRKASSWARSKARLGRVFKKQ